VVQSHPDLAIFSLPIVGSNVAELDGGKLRPVVQALARGGIVMARQSKSTAGIIKQHVKKIEEVTEKLSRENKEKHFTSITPEQIEEKLKRVKPP
jgi:hypothetical protein